MEKSCVVFHGDGSCGRVVLAWKIEVFDITCGRTPVVIDPETCVFFRRLVIREFLPLNPFLALLIV